MMLKTIICSVLLVCFALFGVSQTYKRGLHHGGDNIGLLVHVRLNFLE